MKKSLFFLASAALVLASCNNDVKLDENTNLTDPSQPKEISFKAVSSTPKRAIKRASWNGTTFPGNGDGYGIKLAAYDATKSNIYFDDGDYTWSTGTGVDIIYHDANTPRYWPFADTWLHFLGVSYMTTAANNKISTDFSTYETAGTAVVTLADNSEKQNDLMYGTGYGHVEQKGNALIIPENVPIQFKHALASLVFRVKATVANVITVTSIVVNDAYEAGTFTITNGSYNAQSATNTVSGTWAVTSYGDYTVPSSNIGVLQTTASADKEFLVIPTTTPANSFASFTINYQMNGVDYAYVFTPASLALEQQKKYVYDITFTLHEILVNATVTDWDASTPTNYVDVPTKAFNYVASTSETGTFTLPSATAGTYSCTITGLPADNYKAVVGTGTGSFITAANPSEYTAVGAGEALNISFTITADAGKNQTILIKNDEGTPATLFTLTVAQP